MCWLESLFWFQPGRHITHSQLSPVIFLLNFPLFISLLSYPECLWCFSILIIILIKYTFQTTYFWFIRYYLFPHCINGIFKWSNPYGHLTHWKGDIFLRIHCWQFRALWWIEKHCFHCVVSMEQETLVVKGEFANN